jgi:hypothetical protein
MTYRYYIGSNNRTGRLEEKRALSLITKQFEGFTAYKGLGYWQGKPENTLIIEIETDDKNKVLTLAKTLKNELEQQAIGLLKVGKMSFIS